MSLDGLDREALVSGVLAVILEDCGPGSLLAMEFAMEAGIGDWEDFDPAGDTGLRSAFHDFALAVAGERVGDEIGRIGGELRDEGGRLVGWRAISVPPSWPQEDWADRPAGVCWSWDPDFAATHMGGQAGTRPAVLKARFGADCVDWFETVRLNAASRYTTGDEKELRLLPGVEVEISEIVLLDEFRRQVNVIPVSRTVATTQVDGYGVVTSVP